MTEEHEIGKLIDPLGGKWRALGFQTRLAGMTDEAV
jgi:hypothetical protein